MSAPRVTGAPGPRTAKDQADLEQERLVINRASLVAMWAWPAFHVLDVFMLALLYPAAPYVYFAVLRVAPTLVIAGVRYAGRQSLLSLRWLRAAHVGSFLLMCLSISFMTLFLGGLQSSYVHGLSIVILVHALMVPAPWRRGALTSLPLLGSYPVVLGVAAAVDPAFRAEWTLAALAGCFSHYVFVIGSTVIGAVAGHIVWAGQQQIYRERRLGRYRLEAPIAKGGMGEVWLARDESLGRRVALKLLRSEAGRDPAAAARFEREAQAASMLHDPHTIRIFDYGAADDGVRFIAMEYLPGVDLGTLVHAHGPLPPARAARFMQQACSSLAEAHEAGIVHRDIKPGNLYVTPEHEAGEILKVLDFGIARIVDATEAALTRTGFVAGTPAFMAPELWTGQPADVRSDIYALGATLHFLLTGAMPPGDGVPPPAERPGPLHVVIARCLAPRPEDRFQDVRALQAALARCDGLGEWTAADAHTFWNVVRPRLLQGWNAPTNS